MENWQLTIIILVSILLGALIPLLIMITSAFRRAAREIAEIGGRLTRTLAQIETISDRVELLSRGLKGGETNVADLLAAVSTLAHGLDRNMKIINILTAILSSVGPAIASYLKTRFPAEEIESGFRPESTTVPGNGSSSGVSSKVADTPSGTRKD